MVQFCYLARFNGAASVIEAEGCWSALLTRRHTAGFNGAASVIEAEAALETILDAMDALQRGRLGDRGGGTQVLHLNSHGDVLASTGPPR